MVRSPKSDTRHSVGIEGDLLVDGKGRAVASSRASSHGSVPTGCVFQEPNRLCSNRTDRSVCPRFSRPGPSRQRHWRRSELVREVTVLGEYHHLKQGGIAVDHRADSSRPQGYAMALPDIGDAVGSDREMKPQTGNMRIVVPGCVNAEPVPHREGGYAQCWLLKTHVGPWWSWIIPRPMWAGQVVPIPARPEPDGRRVSRLKADRNRGVRIDIKVVGPAQIRG